MRPEAICLSATPGDLIPLGRPTTQTNTVIAAQALPPLPNPALNPLIRPHASGDRLSFAKGARGRNADSKAGRDGRGRLGAARSLAPRSPAPHDLSAARFLAPRQTLYRPHYSQPNLYPAFRTASPCRV